MKKKVLGVALASMLCAAPLFAEVTTSGEFDFGFSTDFADPDKVGSDGKNGFAAPVLDTAELGFSATAGDYTSISFTFDFTNYDDTTATAKSIEVPNLYFKTDMTGALGVEGPLGISFIAGYTDYFGSQAYDSATRYALDDIADRGMDTHLILGTEISFAKHANLALAFNPNLRTYSEDSAKEGENNRGFEPQVFAGLNGTFSLFTAEAYYLMNSTEDPRKDIVGPSTYTSHTHDSVGADLLAKVPVASGHTLNASASLNFDIYQKDELANKNDNLVTTYGFGLGLVGEKYDAGISTYGKSYDSDNDFVIAFDGGIKLNSLFTLYGGAKFDVTAEKLYFTDKSAADDGKKANSGMELGMQAAIADTKYTLGYQLGAGDIENLTGAEGLFIRMAMKF